MRLNRLTRTFTPDPAIRGVGIALGSRVEDALVLEVMAGRRIFHLVIRKGYRMGKQAARREREALRIIDEGRAAREQGKPREACPYHSRVELRELWMRGYETRSSSGPARNVMHFG